MRSPLPPEAQPFFGDLVTDRQQVAATMELLLPVARSLAERTETLLDDAVVDMVDALHKSELAQEWLANQINDADAQMPPGAMTVTAMPEGVRQDLVMALPGERRDSFLGGALFDQFANLMLPLLVDLLRRVLVK